MDKYLVTLLLGMMCLLQSCGDSKRRDLEDGTKKLQMIEENIKYLYKEINYAELETVKLTVQVKDSASKALADKGRLRLDSLKSEMITASRKADSLREEIAILNKKLYEQK